MDNGGWISNESISITVKIQKPCFHSLGNKKCHLKFLTHYWNKVHKRKIEKYDNLMYHEIFVGIIQWKHQDLKLLIQLTM